MHQKILIVEDESAMREMLYIMFSRYFLEVIVASDARSGMEKILAERPDFVISDTDMPGSASGFDVVALANRLKIPALLVSGEPLHRRKETEIAKIRVGQFVQKPYREREIVPIISRMLEVA